MGASAPIPAELVLGLLRGAIAAGRARAPKLTEGALTFAVERTSGLTDYFTLFITPGEVELSDGAAPLEWEGRLVTVFAHEDALSQLTDGGDLAGAAVHGDAQLLADIAPCLDRGVDWLGVRLLK